MYHHRDVLTHHEHHKKHLVRHHHAEQRAHHHADATAAVLKYQEDLAQQDNKLQRLVDHTIAHGFGRAGSWKDGLRLGGRSIELEAETELVQTQQDGVEDLVKRAADRVARFFELFGCSK